MLQRLRLAMKDESSVKLSGAVKSDETMTGGLARFMHNDKKAKFPAQGATEEFRPLAFREIRLV